MSSARDYFLLIYLSRCLGNIGSELEGFDNIGIDWSEIEPSAPLADATPSATTAIERAKESSNEQWRCELLASALSDVDLKRRTLLHLAKMRDAICQADKPAEMALFDGNDDEAIAICRDAFARAYDQCGREIKRLAAECGTQTKILFPRGFKTEDMPDVVRDLGFDPIARNLATIPTVELSELLERLPAVAPSNLGLIDRLLAGPDHAELTPSELALLEAYLKQPSNRPTLGELADAANGREPSERAAGLQKLKLIRDYNRNLQSVAAKPTIEPKPDTTSAKTRTRRGRPKANYETEQREAQIAADWKQAKEAGTYKGDFAKDRKTTVAELDALLDRVAKRNRPSE